MEVKKRRESEKQTEHPQAASSAPASFSNRAPVSSVAPPRTAAKEGFRASRKSPKTVSDKEVILLAVKETLRYGLFLGTFAGTFASLDEFIAALGGNRRTAKWRALLAGAVAGPSMLLTGLNTQHTSLAIYIFMRAAVLASRCGIKSKRFGRICKPLAWSHGDIFLMCLSSSQSLYVLFCSIYMSRISSFACSTESLHFICENQVFFVQCCLILFNEMFLLQCMYKI